MRSNKMAVYREAPTCPNCGNKIKAIRKKQESWQPPIAGDNFIGWDWSSHVCDSKTQLRDQLIF